MKKIARLLNLLLKNFPEEGTHEGVDFPDVGFGLFELCFVVRSFFGVALDFKLLKAFRQSTELA